MTTAQFRENAKVAMAQMLQCVCAEIEAVREAPLCWCGLWPGANVSWDYCGDCGSGQCGMAYLRPGALFPFSTFPQPTIDVTCRSPYAWEWEIGVLRCFPTMDEDGSLPDDADISETQIALMDDQFAILDAVLCCESDFITQRVVEAWEPAGPGGNCVGGAWSIYVEVNPYAVTA